MASKSGPVPIGAVPALEIPQLEHQGAAAAAAALAEATADETSGSAADAETPLSLSADGTRDRSPATAEPPSSPVPKRGRGRPPGSKTKRLTAERLERESTRDLRAELRERDRQIEQLRGQMNVQQETLEALAPPDQEHVDMARELALTISSTAAIVMQDGRWMLNRGQLERLAQVGAPVVRKYLAEYAGPEAALAIAIAGIVAEKFMQEPQPLAIAVQPVGLVS